MNSFIIGPPFACPTACVYYNKHLCQLQVFANNFPLLKHELHEKDMIVTPLIMQGPYIFYRNGYDSFIVHSDRPKQRIWRSGFFRNRNSEIQRTSIYYCDPMRSGQKGGIEQAHTMLRMVLPKGTSFEFLTQWDVNTIVNKLRPVPPDEVNLTPKLILFNHQ